MGLQHMPEFRGVLMAFRPVRFFLVIRSSLYIQLYSDANEKVFYERSRQWRPHGG